MIRLTVPFIDENEYKAVQDVLKSGFLVQGNKVAQFEQKVAQYVGTQFAVAVSSGTAALHLSLLAADIGPGDIVAVTAYSWIATANIIELCGAKPLFVDILQDSFNINPDALKDVLEKRTKNRGTYKNIKAIIPVHSFGQMADMTSIREIADQYHLTLIEDAACALGAAWDGKQAGSYGRFGCFSFHPRKVITTGEGGMITTDDKKLYTKLCALRNHGFDAEGKKPDFILTGFNYRLTELQAALGIEQLNKLDKIIAVRRNLAVDYDALFKETPFKSPARPEKSDPVFQSYVILLPDSLIEKRTQIIEKLRNKGIESTIGTLHMPMARYYREKYGYKTGDFPVTDKVWASSLTLPLYPGLKKDFQKLIADHLLDFL